MNRIIAAITAIIIAVGAAAATPATATVTRRCNAASSGVLTLVADSIMFRDDVTRLYGKLRGTPHTSSRIDSMILTAPGDIAALCTDLDGADLRRWFQWEDDGLIPVEIDFPAMKPVGTATVTVCGPRGESTWIITIGK